MKIRFEIDSQGEDAAGIRGFTESITLDVESGDPGGESGQFAEFMREALADWFDGATVEIRDTRQSQE